MIQTNIEEIKMTMIRDEIMDLWCKLKSTLDDLEPIADKVQELELDHDGYRATQQIWHDKHIARIEELTKQVKSLESLIHTLQKENAKLRKEQIDSSICIKKQNQRTGDLAVEPTENDDDPYPDHFGEIKGNAIYHKLSQKEKRLVKKMAEEIDHWTYKDNGNGILFDINSPDMLTAGIVTIFKDVLDIEVSFVAGHGWFELIY